MFFACSAVSILHSILRIDLFLLFGQNRRIRGISAPWKDSMRRGLRIIDAVTADIYGEAGICGIIAHGLCLRLRDFAGYGCFSTVDRTAVKSKCPLKKNGQWGISILFSVSLRNVSAYTQHKVAAFSPSSRRQFLKTDWQD